MSLGMDSYEATKVVFSRIQALDPDNASKIMGFVFIQDPCEKEMIRLAYGPETILISLINQAKTHLGILSASSPRVVIPNDWVPDQLDEFDFSPVMSPSGHSDSMVFPPGSGIGMQHRRSFSVNDAYMGGEEGMGFGWKPCMYYQRGFCKNGGNCKFLHGGGQFGDLSENGGGMLVGSPSNNMEGFDELLRMKAMQQQQRISQIMANGGVGGYPYNKGIGFMNDSPRSAAASLMMGEELHKFSRSRSERCDFSAMGLGPDSSARQIYLTFPADSTFKEEDVSNYFSKFGPVQDVRIPYQQKRMFGFVTFIYPETVKMILAKGNPHFVCDSRVLVKPYKEKGKLPEKRHHQFERGDFAACLSPTGLDSIDSYDFPVGPRVLFNNQEMLRRKLEQAEYQQALELQGRRLMNLQLMDLKNQQNHHHHQAHQFHPPGISISSPVHSHLQTNRSFLLPSENSYLEDSSNSLVVAGSPTAAAGEQHDDELHEVKDFCINNNADDNGNSEDFFNPKNDDHYESLEHILPDNLFASPTKAAGENGSIFSSAPSEAVDGSSVVAAPSSTNNTASQESRYFHLPRFSSGQEAVEM